MADCSAASMPEKITSLATFLSSCILLTIINTSEPLIGISLLPPLAALRKAASGSIQSLSIAPEPVKVAGCKPQVQDLARAGRRGAVPQPPLGRAAFDRHQPSRGDELRPDDAPAGQRC